MNGMRTEKGLKICQAFGLLVLLQLFAAPLATRFGLVSYRIGLPVTALAVLGGLILLIASLVMLLMREFRDERRRLLAIAAVAAVPLLAGILMMAPAVGRPAIHDISTDIADPPQFQAALAARGADANPLDRGPELDAQQRAGYPQLGSLDSALSPVDALARAGAVARDLGWQVHGVDPSAGRLEASETSFWFGFTDDIVVRVRARDTGSRIDLRSVSRVGRGDLGANARRIQRFIDAF